MLSDIKTSRNLQQTLLRHQMTKSTNKTKENNISKKPFSFEKCLVLMAVILIAFGSFESLAHKYFPDLSILNFLHFNGYLKNYPIIHEPSKGIWIDLGWIGSFMMITMMLYSLRKRTSLFNKVGSLRHWLSAHMFLGIMGPVLITFHTTFKFHGIIATSFWCMVIAMFFGILGRYIYVQIPRSMTGAELKVNDIDEIVAILDGKIGKYLSGTNMVKLSGIINPYNVNDAKHHFIGTLLSMMKTDIKNRFQILRIRRILKRHFKLNLTLRNKILTLLKRKSALIRRKNFLATSHTLLHYWHVLHVPLAVVTFLIMFIHIGVYFLFRPGS